MSSPSTASSFDTQAWTSTIYIPQTTTVTAFLFGTNGFRYVSENNVLASINVGTFKANGPLTTENVFEYFAASMFYDKQSNNQVLRMQTMHTGQPILNEAEELK